VDQITRDDILQFMTDCYKHGLGKRTVYDKLVVVLQLFKRYGKIKLIESTDWPEYVDTIRPIYEAEEIEAMLKHADQDEALSARHRKLDTSPMRNSIFPHNLVISNPKCPSMSVN
jgi:site-specific recombinase XerD